MLKQVKCDLCGSDNYTVVYKTYAGDMAIEQKSYAITDHALNVPLRIVKCQKCGLIYANPRPPVRSLISNYGKMVDDLYVAEEKGRRLAARQVLKELKKFRKKGRLLDIGCATGFLLDEARKDGWQVYGVDLSSWAVEYARHKLGLDNIFKGALKDAGYHDNFFDVVVMKDTIEHLTDPKATLVEIRRILRSSGILCVNTPNIGSFISRALKAKWWGVNQAHLYYFTRATLHKMLRTVGFTPVRTKSHVRVFTTDYWVDRFKEYSKTIYSLLNFLIRHGVIKRGLISINFGDQIEVYARKTRSLAYLEELEKPIYTGHKKDMKVVVVLPAYNAARTLERTVSDIPEEFRKDIILVDDSSSDNTVRLAKSIGLKVFEHKDNMGYGANQKTCYEKALAEGADIVVMVHPDYQYDPRAIPHLVEPIRSGRADAVFGSRMMKGGALEGGMPVWKHSANILLTALENVIFGTFLTEYHSGFRAYSANVLRAVNFAANSDGFIFDTEIVAQILLHGFKIEEVPIRTRYFDEASTVKFWAGVLYGLGILKTLVKYILHTRTFIKFRQFR